LEFSDPIRYDVYESALQNKVLLEFKQLQDKLKTLKGFSKRKFWKYFRLILGITVSQDGYFESDQTTTFASLPKWRF
jgi:hypothetical protein